MTTEAFLALCYKCKLSRMDIEDMPINMIIQYIEEYVESLKEQKPKPKKATQADFDAF